MTKASISKVKAELSKFVRLARSGDEIIIMDRDKPVALLTGIKDPDSKISIMKAKSESKYFFSELKKKKYIQETDILDVLVADREDRF